MAGDALDAFNTTLSYLLRESVGRLSAEDRQERIDYCQRTASMACGWWSRRTARPVSTDPESVADELVALGAHAPGDVAWRALDRLREGGSLVTDAGHRRAEAVLVSGLRSLFNPTRDDPAARPA